MARRKAEAGLRIDQASTEAESPDGITVLLPSRCAEVLFRAFGPVLTCFTKAKEENLFGRAEVVACAG